MIEVTIAEAAKKRGIENPKQLADRMGVAPTIIWRYWTGLQMPGLPVLDRICEALEPCDLSELIRRRADKKGKEPPARRSVHKKAGRKAKTKAGSG